MPHDMLVGNDDSEDGMAHMRPSPQPIVHAVQATMHRFLLLVIVSLAFADGARAQVVLQHPALVYWGAFSPDGERVATVAADGIGRIWSLSGTVLDSLIGHTAPATGIEFSPDGSRVVTASFDSTARIWDVETGTLVHTLSGHGGRVRQAVFSKDGTMVATASLDGTARIWNSASGDTLHVLRGHTAGIFDIAFSPDGRIVATASNDFTARLWDVESGTSIATLERHSQRLLWIAFNHTGDRIVTAGFDPVAYLWDSTGGLVDSVVHQSRVNSAQFSADDRNLLTASFDTTARLTTLDGSSPSVVLRGHTEPLLWAEFGAGDTKIATCGFDNSARVYAAADGSTLSIHSHTGRVVRASFNAAGTTLLTVGFDSTAKIWPLTSGRIQHGANDQGLLDVRLDGNGSGRIEYKVERLDPVSVTIVDTRGVEVVKVYTNPVDTGSGRIEFDARALTGGWYVCALWGSRGLLTTRFSVVR